jgi:hypothetical protein
MNSGHPVVNRFGGGKPGALEHVAGLVFDAEQSRGAEIAEFRLLARHAAQKRVPHMPVGFDQPGQYDRSAAVDHLGARCANALADGHDDSVLHMHIATGDVTEREIHCHDVGAADDEIPACGKSAAPRVRRFLARGAGFARRKRADRCKGRGAAQKAAPTDRHLVRHDILPILPARLIVPRRLPGSLVRIPGLHHAAAGYSDRGAIFMLDGPIRV